uniref:Uncharacterized protein n=1 Tax=Picea glauca TaxID=3330 RepID=A0A101LUS8_PICGL|nr:hypothetical protein ABT39_MTgene2320 [Picea glauca]QHR89297.1 hypothetical protein Q903MT_gene3318 [Picea sitchensis]
MPFGKESICGFDAVKRRGGPTIINIKQQLFTSIENSLIIKSATIIMEGPSTQNCSFRPLFLIILDIES